VRAACARSLRVTPDANDPGVAPPGRIALLDSNARIAVIATSTVRDLDDDLRALLRVRAARHGRSMEAEVRA
jgi:hypothetical protein